MSEENMFLQDSDEVQDIVHEAPAYFSGEEWKLLHKWQKELYRNVMKEIQQALISLGPLIATTVFSLISKEEKEIIPVENQYSGEQHNAHLHRSPTDDLIKADDLITYPKVTSRTNSVESQFVKTDMNRRRVEKKGRFNTGIPYFNTDHCLRKGEESVFDQLDEQVGQIITDPSSGHEVISICIKGEEETYDVDQDSDRVDCISTHTGNGRMERKRTIGYSLKSNDNSALCKSAKSLKSNLVQNSDGKQQLINQVGPERDWDLKAEDDAQCYSVSKQQAHSNVHPLTLYGQRLETNENMMRNDNLNPCESNPLLNLRPHNYPQGDQTRKKNCHSENERAYRVHGKYICNACGKIFSNVSKLVSHERIHTGEKPFHCTLCGKSFNQSGVLHRHQKMHTGERPFQCTECGKSFNRKHHLLGHQKIHSKTR